MHSNTFALVGTQYIVSALFLLCSLVFSTASAQDATSPVVTADNIRQLQSVAQLNFDELPPEVGVVDKGWFATTFDGETYAIINRDNGVVQWNVAEGYSGTTAAICDDTTGNFIDGAYRTQFDETNTRQDLFVVVYQNPTGYSIGYHPIGHESVVTSCSDRATIPIRIWVDESGAENWLEMIPFSGTEPPFISHHPILFGREGDTVDAEELPSAPDTDLDAFLRIGRIDPPLAVTVSREGLTKRWNLELGEVTAEAQIDTLPAAGQVNAVGSHLAWVDQEFDTLHLLNFETGEDQLVADLEGIYIPFLLLTSDADVIIAVNVEYESAVIAWDVATGERIELGEYRSCIRPQPDMVRLSKDGTTLAIGCDTGLDIWRVK